MPLMPSSVVEHQAAAHEALGSVPSAGVAAAARKTMCATPQGMGLSVSAPAHSEVGSILSASIDVKLQSQSDMPNLLFDFLQRLSQLWEKHKTNPVTVAIELTSEMIFFLFK